MVQSIGKPPTHPYPSHVVLPHHGHGPAGPAQVAPASPPLSSQPQQTTEPSCFKAQKALKEPVMLSTSWRSAWTPEPGQLLEASMQFPKLPGQAPNAAAEKSVIRDFYCMLSLSRRSTATCISTHGKSGRRASQETISTIFCLTPRNNPAIAANRGKGKCSALNFPHISEQRLNQIAVASRVLCCFCKKFQVGSVLVACLYAS